MQGNPITRSAVAAMIFFGGAPGCSSSTQPPDVASAPGGFGSSTPYPTPCPSSSNNGDAGSFDLEAGLDAGLGIGTTNPTTPSDGGTAFSGDATTAPGGDSGTPCR